MSWLSCVKIKVLLIGFVAAIVLGSEIANADFTFGRPTNLGPAVNSSSDEIGSTISADGLSLYFASNRAGGSGEYDLWVSIRPSVDAPWGQAVNLGPRVNSQYSEMGPSISSDGLSLYFSDPHSEVGFGRPRPGGFAPGDGGNVWVVTRATVNDPWSEPVNLGSALNSAKYKQVVQPSIFTDGLSLYVHACNYGIGVAKRTSTAEPFGTPEVLRFPANNMNAWWPGISRDGRALFFTQWTGAVFELWLTRRPTADSDFGPPTKLPGYINVPNYQVLCPNLSGDGSSLYFDSTQPGGLGHGDLWQAPIIPIVDFNGDGIVDAADMCIMVDHWGTDEPFCDIGPMPWGDGVVDVQDLIVLSEYLFEEVNDSTLIAHWPLDEAQGGIAYNSAADCDGTLMGGPVWQPDGGMVVGALQFDGIDDYVSTDPVLNPADGKFSVVAWAKGALQAKPSYRKPMARIGSVRIRWKAT